MLQNRTTFIIGARSTLDLFGESTIGYISQRSVMCNNTFTPISHHFMLNNIASSAVYLRQNR